MHTQQDLRRGSDWQIDTAQRADRKVHGAKKRGVSPTEGKIGRLGDHI